MRRFKFWCGMGMFVVLFGGIVAVSVAIDGWSRTLVGVGVAVVVIAFTVMAAWLVTDGVS
jgi:hypothetical protein